MRILVIQTAFIGDVILATPVIEKLHRFYPDAAIDILVRKGNENLLENHPFLHELLIWDKKKLKYANLFRLSRLIRKRNYEVVINLQRFAASGFLTWRSGAGQRIGFDKNPFAFSYTYKVKHDIGSGLHETLRNLQLIERLTDNSPEKPRLYPSSVQEEKVQHLKTTSYICMAPTSVWFTKQLPPEKWTALIREIPANYKVYLLGAPGDTEACEFIRKEAGRVEVENLCGKLSLLESAALMRDAAMNYVNDSAPMHIASAMNAPVTAFFCSTVPAFGFGPLSDRSAVVETKEPLSCRPCGLHGYKACPEHHFRCAYGIELPEVPV